MKHILVVFKKEMKRFFFDRRMLLAMFLPGILIFTIYTFMGRMMHSNLFSSSTKNTAYQVVYTNNYAENTEDLPEILKQLDTYIKADNIQNGNTNSVTFEDINPSQIEEYKTLLSKNKIHLLVSFSDNFDDLVKTGSGNNNITLLYNGETSASENIYKITSSLLQTAYNNYTVNIEIHDGQAVPIKPDIGKKNATMAKVMSFILPMVTVSLLYATITSFCPESISGEKERGTLASMLLTPIKRSEFVLGKILALSLIAIASGIVSFIGFAASLPEMMGMSSLPFTIGEMVLLFFIIISTLILFVTFGVFISSMCNTVKEAGSYLGPLSAVLMFVALIPLFVGSGNIAFAFIPVLNLSACINALLVQAGNIALLFGLTVASNLIYSGLLIFAITRLFNKEKIVLGN